MRNDQKLVAVQLAPAARISIPQFNEVDGSFVLIVPDYCAQLMLLGIDAHEGAWPDERIHGEVVQTNVAIQGCRGTSAFVRSDRRSVWQSCTRHDAGPTFAQYGIRRNRKMAKVVSILCFRRYELGHVWISNGRIFFNLINIDIIKLNQIYELHTIDHTQTE